MDLFNKRLLKQESGKKPLINTKDFDNAQKVLEKIIKFLLKDANRTKEKPIQGLFLQRVFEVVLKYPSQLTGQDNFNLLIEESTEFDSSKPDGILGFFNHDRNIEAVIELKSTDIDLDQKQSSRKDKKTPVEQAFEYSIKFDSCKWIIVSNFNEIRLYSAERGINYYEKFNLSDLVNLEDFNKFYFLFLRNNLLSEKGPSLVENLLRETSVQEENITKEFYEKYRKLRTSLFTHLALNNQNINKYILLEKTQKIIDRIIFICFCEDLGLLPYNVFRNILETSKSSYDISQNKIWNQLKGLFHLINVGSNKRAINKFNGGLFSEDSILDNLMIKDEVIKDLIKISEYDFESDLNVNILGHIFEQSISDIEKMKSRISDDTKVAGKEKRKKEGIYYTLEYITKYIVEESIGAWLEERKRELGFYELPNLTEKDYSSIKLTKKSKLKTNKIVEQHIKFWEKYREELKNIKVLDPACGSGAFLIQAFDYLYKEGQFVNDELAKLQKGYRQIFDLDKHILTNNLYGVDLNEESVEITKLSLWLKTANKEKKLTHLDNNIKCGNSLIDEQINESNKTFKWKNEFSNILICRKFKYHILIK